MNAPAKLTLSDLIASQRPSRVIAIELIRSYQRDQKKLSARAAFLSQQGSWFSVREDWWRCNDEVGRIDSEIGRIIRRFDIGDAEIGGAHYQTILDMGKTPRVSAMGTA